MPKRAIGGGAAEARSSKAPKLDECDGAEKKTVAEEEEASLSVSQQRRLQKASRLLQKNPAHEFVLECNRLYAQLIARENEAKRQSCVERCLEYIDAFDERSAEAFAGKARAKPVSRCLQMCLKYGSLEQRSFILERLTPVFAELCMNDVGSHLAKKMFAYSTAEQRAALAARLLAEKSSALFYSRFASAVVELFCECEETGGSFDGKEFRTTVMRRLCVPRTLQLQLGDSFESVHPHAAFYRVDSRGRKQMHEKIAAALGKFADKHLTDRTYVQSIVELATAVADEAQLKEYLSTLEGKLPPLLQTRLGTIALTRLIHVMDAKNRRNFVQELKSGGVAMNEFLCNAASSPAFLKLCVVTDDTQLLRRQLLAPALALEKNGKIREFDVFREACFSPAGCRVVLSLVAGPSPRWLPAKQVELYTAPSPTSKKDSRVRQAECLELLWPALCELLCSDLANPDTALRWLCDSHVRDVPWALLAVACSSSSAVVTEDARKQSRAVVTALLRGLRGLAKEGRLGELLDRPVGNSSVSQLLRIAPAKAGDAKALQRREKVLKATPFLADLTLLKAEDGTSFVAGVHELLVENLDFTLRGRAVFLLVDSLQLGRETGEISASAIESTVKKCRKRLSRGEWPEDSPGLRLFREKFLC